MPNVTSKDYWNNVRATAEEVLENIAEYGGYATDWLHESVDGDQWIIYYALNDEVLRYSNNPDAWEGCYTNADIGQIVTSSGMDHARMVQAYFAMLEDATEEVYALAAERGIDIE